MTKYADDYDPRFGFHDELKYSPTFDALLEIVAKRKQREEQKGSNILKHRDNKEEQVL